MTGYRSGTSKTAAAVVAVGLAAAIAASGIIIMPLFVAKKGVVSEESNSYIDDTLPTGKTSTARVVVPGPLPSFNYNFGSGLGNVPFSVTWKAPPGKVIEIRLPTGFDFGNVVFTYLGGSFQESGGKFETNNPSVVASGLVGPDPILTGSVYLAGPVSHPSTPRFRAVAIMSGLTPGRRIYFKEVTVSTSVNASHNTHFDNLPVTIFKVEGSVTVDGPAGTLPPDPGQWVRVIDNPAIAQLERRIAKVRRQMRKATRLGKKRQKARLKRKLARLKKRLPVLRVL